MTDIEHAKKYAEESISLAISMYNPKAEIIAETACLYGLTFKNERIAELEKENAELRTRVRELEQQIEKLIDFVLSKSECCDVCPITDTCINSEGTCPYAGILAKGEEEVTREWLMQFISKEIKEK